VAQNSGSFGLGRSVIRSGAELLAPKIENSRPKSAVVAGGAICYMFLSLSVFFYSRPSRPDGPGARFLSPFPFNA
jgi:hypothetical protein